MSRNPVRVIPGTLLLGAAALALALASSVATPLRAAETWIDLDGNPANGAESRVVTRVLQSYPVRVENVILNNATGESFTFTWPGAGPGGFDSFVARGPDVGVKWEWSTVSQVYSIQSPATFKLESRSVPVFGAPTGGIQGGGGAQAGAFTVPGKSIYPTQVTVSSASLTSSLVTFFSPENTLATCAGSFQPGRFEQVITNNSGSAVTFTVEQPGCCPEPQMTICEDGCQFYLTDPDNCGGCGIQCAGDEYCDQGSCEPICPAGQTLCGEFCFDLSSDPANCGACGNACASDEYCDTGACTPICPAGQTLCGEFCLDLANDPDNCGACGNACASDEYCDAGACTPICPAGQTLCGETCVDLSSDRANCGACGTVCDANAICGAGACSPCRPPLQTRCDNTCVNIHTDPYNCGGCGNVCDFSDCPSTGTGTCSQGSSCVCDVAAASSEQPLFFAPRLRDSAVRARGSSERRAPAAATRQRGATRTPRLDAGALVASSVALPDVVRAPVCDVAPVTQTLQDGESFTRCESGALVGKEIFTTATVLRDGVAIGQGPCALIVPAPEAPIPAFLPSTVAVWVQDAMGDGLCQPGETCDALIAVQNLGTEPFIQVVGTLSSPPDAFNPSAVTFLNAASQYPDFPAFSGAADCETPAQLDPQTNHIAYSFTLPIDQEPDVGRVFNLGFRDGSGSGAVVNMPLVIGIGKRCDPTAALDGETYDGLDGLQSPVSARLVPEGNPVQYSAGAFNQTKTIPLKLSLQCGSATLGPDQIDPTPKIVGLEHETLGDQPLTNINGKNGANPDNPFFDCSTNHCEYQLRTKDLPLGLFVISIELPDTRVFQAGFELRP